jgi:hypothetical protein
MSILAIIALVLASMQGGPALAGARSPRRLAGPATETRGRYSSPGSALRLALAARLDRR